MGEQFTLCRDHTLRRWSIAEVGDASDNEALASEPAVECDQIPEATDEERRSDNENEGHGNLRNNETSLNRCSFSAS
jgi:hypothetical protein